MKELIGTTIYRKADGTETEAKIFFNGDGNNMTFRIGGSLMQKNMDQIQFESRSEIRGLMEIVWIWNGK